jgi:hypothetical protein
VMVPFSSGWSRRIDRPSRTSSLENASVSLYGSEASYVFTLVFAR